METVLQNSRAPETPGAGRVLRQRELDFRSAHPAAQVRGQSPLRLRHAGEFTVVGLLKRDPDRELRAPRQLAAARDRDVHGPGPGQDEIRRCVASGIVRAARGFLAAAQGHREDGHRKKNETRFSYD